MPRGDARVPSGVSRQETATDVELPRARRTVSALASTGGTWLRALAAGARTARVDIAIIVTVTGLAAALRLWHLGTVPLGIHGDEAWTGLDARRVLHEGWIGPYVDSALGQPTGPLYVTALLFSFLPDTTTTVRASMALLGVATVPLAYAAFGSMFNRTAGAFAALLLAVMMWHLHLSRTAFMVVSWPFVEMAVLWALWQAMRRGSWWLFAVAGALHGMGIYAYNVYLLFLPVPFVTLAWAWWSATGAVEKRRVLAGAASFAVAAMIVAVPMVRYVIDHGDEYREHQRVVALTDSQRWKDAGAGGRVELIRDRAEEWGRGLAQGDRPDYGDGLATAGHPVVAPAVLLLALGGLAMAAWNWRRAENVTLLAACALLPGGALLTVGDGLFRRTLGLAPFVAVLAALPLAWVWQRLSAAPRPACYVCRGALLAAVAAIGAQATYQYFGPVQDAQEMRIVYPYQLDAASRYMEHLPEGTYVYFFSSRWSFDYETRRFLAPDVSGEDRSREFGQAPVAAGGALDFSARPSGDVAFVFLAPYLDDVARAITRYPGGEPSQQQRGNEVMFRAYLVRRPS